MTATPAAFADDRETVGDIDPALYTDVLQPGSGCALPVPAALCDATQDREITDDVFDRAFEMASEYNRELKDYSIVATAWLAKLQSEPPRALAMRMLQKYIEYFLLEVTTFMSTTHEEGVAMAYARADGGTLLAIEQHEEARGAALQWLS